MTGGSDACLSTVGNACGGASGELGDLCMEMYFNFFKFPILPYYLAHFVLMAFVFSLLRLFVLFFVFVFGLFQIIQLKIDLFCIV